MAWFKESLDQLEVGRHTASSPDPGPKFWGGEGAQPSNQCPWLLMVGRVDSSGDDDAQHQVSAPPTGLPKDHTVARDIGRQAERKV